MESGFRKADGNNDLAAVAVRSGKPNDGLAMFPSTEGLETRLHFNLGSTVAIPSPFRRGKVCQWVGRLSLNSLETMNEYAEFLKQKAHPDDQFGFKPLWLPDFLFHFQNHLLNWMVRKGRAAVFADCGL